MKRSHLGTILLAVLLIAIAAVVIGINFFGWAPYWFAGWWTLPIMAAAVVSVISNGLHYWNSLMFGTAVLLLARMQDTITHMTWRQWWAAEVALALILLGIALLVRMVRPRKEKDLPPPVQAAGTGEPGDPYAYPPQENEASNAPPSGDSNPSRFAMFSSEVCRSDCKQLRGGRFTSIFGSVTVDLTQADFLQPVTIETYTLFGGVDIIVPQNVRVESNGTSIFGGCDTKSIAGRPYDPSHAPITIRYFNVFGGVNVK